MAKNRMVNTRIWGDTYIASLDCHGKLLFNYLLTNIFTNIAGVYEITLGQMLMDTAIPKDKLIELLAKFERDKKIVYKEGWIVMLNHLKHQDTTSAKIVKGIEYVLENIPDRVINHLIDIGASITKYMVNNKRNITNNTEVVVSSPDIDDSKMTDVVEIWNKFSETYGLSKVSILSDKRKAGIKARFKEKEFNLKEILTKVAKSSFLLGKTTEWKITFDFIFCSKNNYLKILEGNYDGLTHGSQDRIINSAITSIQRIKEKQHG